MKRIFFLLIIFFTSLHINQASSFEGIHDMNELGRGEVRYFGLIKIYEATLYVKRAVVRKRVLNPDTSRCLKLDYSLSLTAKDIIKGANAILLRQNTQAKLAQIQMEIEKLHMVLKDVKGGDSYLICYNATNQTTTLVLNEEELVSVVSADFGSVYFAIWLGPDEPIDEKLREKLLINAKQN